MKLKHSRFDSIKFPRRLDKGRNHWTFLRSPCTVGRYGHYTQNNNRKRLLCGGHEATRQKLFFSLEIGPSDFIAKNLYQKVLIRF